MPATASVTITAAYAGVLAFIYVLMTVNVIRNRRRFRIGLGNGKSTRFLRIVRGHGNFAEYVPITLVLMALAELSGAPDHVLHIAGGALLAGRLLHATCFMLMNGNMRARVGGMVLTFVAMITGAVQCLRIAIGA